MQMASFAMAGASLPAAAGPWGVPGLRPRQIGNGASGEASGGGDTSGGRGGRRPNVLVLLTDDQTYRSIHMLGNAQIRTPNLDRLAGRGTTLSHCFNQGGWHGAICMASRAMINTGRHLNQIVTPHDAGAAGWLQTDVPLFGQHFRDHGYNTFGTGKWHNGGDSFARSFSHGDAVFLGGMHPFSDERAGGGDIILGHDHPRLQHYDGQAGTYEQYEPGAWSTDAFADAAIDFLDGHGQSPDPFMMYVSFTAPHDPRHAPADFLDMYKPEDIELPPNFLPEHPFDQGDARIRDEVLLGFPREPADVQREIAIYYAMITHIDARIGDIFEKLDAVGQADNTYIVFTSDHGLAVGQHGLMGKQNQYDHSVRTPMIWAGPGIAPGESTEQFAYIHQTYATMCEFAGLETPAHIQAPSLGPVIRGEAEGYETIFGMYRDLQRMIRTDRHKLIRYPHNGELQLFDMQADPWEIADLAEDPANAQLIRDLDAKLRAWQPIVGDALELAALG